MSQRIIESIAELKKLVGQEVGVSEYLQVPQDKILQFAELTGDRQWIHCDLERAKRESPYGATIAHGFLTLSLMTRLMKEALEVRGVRMGINYGLDRVRFPAPVPADARIRARVALQGVEDIAGGVQAKWSVALECEGAQKPSCAAEWLVRYYE